MNAKNSNWSSVWLALRSLLWTILLPGIVAGYVPWRFFGVDHVRLNLGSPADLLGILCIGVGVVLLVSSSLQGAVGAHCHRSIRRDTWSFAVCIVMYGTRCTSVSQ